MACKDDSRYRPCAGIMLLNQAGEVFVGERLKGTDGTWQMPQGGIDPGEAPRDAALREMAEEIGTAKAEIIAESPGWLYYEIPKNKRPKRWGGKYVGQKQIWFLLRFQGNDGDIDIETAHPEFKRWKWAPLQDLPDLAIDFKRDLYRRIMAEFAHLTE